MASGSHRLALMLATPRFDLDGDGNHRVADAQFAPPCAGAWLPWRDVPHTGAPFLAPAFFALTQRHFGHGRPWLVGDVDAVLPLVREGYLLAALRSEHTPRFDLSGDAGALPVIWRKLESDRSWRVLSLDGVSESSPLATVLPELARRDGCRVAVQKTSRAPYFELAGFEERLDKEFRRQLKKRAKKIENLAFERVTAYDAGAMQDLLRLESSGWKEGEGTSIASSAETMAFYADLIHAFAETGQLSLCFLKSGHTRIAVQLALEDETTCYLLKTGYDPAYRNLGAGHLVIFHYALDARARGKQIVDLCGTKSDAKACWTDLAHQRVNIRVYRGALGNLEYLARHVVRPQIGKLRRALARHSHG
jgi:hypothetical protein